MRKVDTNNMLKETLERYDSDPAFNDCLSEVKENVKMD